MHDEARRERRIDLEHAQPQEVRRRQMLEAARIVAHVARIFRADAARGALDLVGRHDRAGALAERLGMRPCEMRDVEKTFDLPPGGAVDVDGRRQDRLEIGIVPRLELRQALVITVERAPDQTEALHRRERHDAQLRRDRKLRMRRHQRAAPVGCVVEAVIGTDDGVVLHPAAAERGAAMRTEVARHACDAHRSGRRRHRRQAAARRLASRRPRRSARPETTRATAPPSRWAGTSIRAASPCDPAGAAPRPVRSSSWRKPKTIGRALPCHFARRRAPEKMAGPLARKERGAIGAAYANGARPPTVHCICNPYPARSWKKS